MAKSCAQKPIRLAKIKLRNLMTFLKSVWYITPYTPGFWLGPHRSTITFWRRVGLSENDHLRARDVNCQAIAVWSRGYRLTSNRTIVKACGNLYFVPAWRFPRAVRCSHASRDPTTSFLVESTIVFERLVPLVLLLAIQRPSDPISRLLQKVIWRSPPVTDSHSNEWTFLSTHW